MFAAPGPVTLLLVLINVVAFAVSLSLSGGGAIDAQTLHELGGNSRLTLLLHEYWRLVTAAFLHANGLHLTTNMICLLSWGGLLERRIGATYFLLVYVGSAVAGNLSSIFGHAD